jgi:homoserine O-acetyltransferase
MRTILRGALASLVICLSAASGLTRADVGVVQKRGFQLAEFTTQSGQTLKNVRVGYETYGKLNAARDNAIFVAHFFTGTSHAAGRYRADDKRVGYWDAIIGAGRAIDTDRYFVISADTLVNATRSQGAITTGPSSVNPETGKPYGATFPIVTPRDFVRVHRELLEFLGVRKLVAVAGASAGSMQAMEWAAAYPELVERVVHVTGPGLAMQSQFAWFDLIPFPAPAPQRADPPRADPPRSDAPGVRTPYGPGRAAPLILVADAPANRAPQAPAPAGPDWGALEEWIRRSGLAQVMNYDLAALTWSAKAYQLYNLEQEASRIRAKVLFIPAKSDALFPPELSQRAAERLKAQGNQVEVVVIDGGNGHMDGVLAIAQAAEAIRAFLRK